MLWQSGASGRCGGELSEDLYDIEYGRMDGEGEGLPQGEEVDDDGHAWVRAPPYGDVVFGVAIERYAAASVATAQPIRSATALPRH